MRGRGFAPLIAQLRCGFEQRGGPLLQTEASFESASLLRCFAPARLQPGTARVRASIDGGASFALDAPTTTTTSPGAGARLWLGIGLGFGSPEPYP